MKDVLEAAQIENEINHLEKNKTDTDSLKEDYKEFIKNKKLILKSIIGLLKKLTRLL